MLNYVYSNPTSNNGKFISMEKNYCKESYFACSNKKIHHIN